MTDDLDRAHTILADVARFADTARCVVSRGHDCFIDQDNDDQRCIPDRRPAFALLPGMSAGIADHS